MPKKEEGEGCWNKCELDGGESERSAHAAHSSYLFLSTPLSSPSLLSLFEGRRGARPCGRASECLPCGEGTIVTWYPQGPFSGRSVREGGQTL